MFLFAIFGRMRRAAVRRPSRSSLALVAAAMLAACGGGQTPAPTTQHTLSVAAHGSGTVHSQPAGIQCAPTCAAAFDAHSSVTLSAAPAAGQLFSGWGGECTGTETTCTLTLSEARTVTAGFVPAAPSHASLTVSVSGTGAVTSQPAGIDCGSRCSASYALNTSVTLSATPGAGQVLSGWGGACGGAGLSCTVVMSQVRSASASFVAAPAVQRSLSVSLTGNGTVRTQPIGLDCGSTCRASFGEGSSVLLSATPAAGQRFAGWSGACGGTAATCTLTMSQDRSVDATFAAASTAPAWQTAQLLETNNDFNVPSRVLTAISPGGDAMVLWEQSDGTPDGNTRKLFSRRYVVGQGWDPAVAVPGVSTNSSSTALAEGKLLMDAAGTATWLRPNLETRRFTAANGWGAPFVPSARAAGMLSAAVMDAGGAIGVVTSGQDVYNISLPARSDHWLDWARVDTSGNLDAKDADVAISSDGTAMAIWREHNPGDANYSIKAARYAPQAGGWQAPQTIDDSFDNVSPETAPRVAMDAAGNAIAVWHQGNSLYFNLFSATGGWGTATPVDANAVSASFTAQIRIVMAATGRAVVTWRSGIFALKSMQYTPGSGFSAPMLVNAYGVNSHLGQDADGNAVLVYVAPDRWPNPSTGSDVYTRRLTWGASWGDAVPIEPLDGLGADAFAAFNHQGQGVAAWVRGDVSGSSARKSLWVNLLR